MAETHLRAGVFIVSFRLLSWPTAHFIRINHHGALIRRHAVRWPVLLLDASCAGGLGVHGRIREILWLLLLLLLVAADDCASTVSVLRLALLDDRVRAQSLALDVSLAIF